MGNTPTGVLGVPTIKTQTIELCAMPLELPPLVKSSALFVFFCFFHSLRGGLSGSFF